MSHAPPPDWNSATRPDPNDRILVFSPDYPAGHEMRFRTMSGQFYKTVTDGSMWIRCEDLLPKVSHKWHEETCDALIRDKGVHRCDCQGGEYARGPRGIIKRKTS